MIEETVFSARTLITPESDPKRRNKSPYPVILVRPNIFGNPIRRIVSTEGTWNPSTIQHHIVFIPISCCLLARRFSLPSSGCRTPISIISTTIISSLTVQPICCDTQQFVHNSPYTIKHRSDRYHRTAVPKRSFHYKEIIIDTKKLVLH